jgi:hypothetical protein
VAHDTRYGDWSGLTHSRLADGRPVVNLRITGRSAGGSVTSGVVWVVDSVVVVVSEVVGRVTTVTVSDVVPIVGRVVSGLEV